MYIAALTFTKRKQGLLFGTREKTTKNNHILVDICSRLMKGNLSLINKLKGSESCWIIFA